MLFRSKTRFKIIALHHNLFQVVTTPGESLRNLKDHELLLQVAREGAVNLILHGHDHDYVYKKIDNIIVAEAGSCSVCRFKRPNRAGKFNRYFFEQQNLVKIETWRYEDDSYVLWRTITP